MANKISSRQQWSFDTGTQTLDKKRLIDLYTRQTFARTNQMFVWENLPDTIPKKDLEFILQMYGSATVTKVDDKLYAFYGTLGGMPNAYYLPTISVVANPYLKFNKTLTIGEDCVVALNDTMYNGLYPTINKYANLLAECDISFKYACVNSRIPVLINANDDDGYETAVKLFKAVENGESYGITLTNNFVENITAFDYASKSTQILNLIELRQYLKGTFEQELGIKSSFNMKRETLNESETSLDDDGLRIFVDDMLEQRQLACERINAMYGTNISVRLSSSWERLAHEQELELERLENEVESTEVETTESSDTLENIEEKDGEQDE